MNHRLGCVSDWFDFLPLLSPLPFLPSLVSGNSIILVLQDKTLHFYLLLLSVRGLRYWTQTLVAGSRCYSPVVVHRLLLAVAPLVEHGLWGTWAQ